MDKNNTLFALFHETIVLIDDLSLFFYYYYFIIQMKNDILNG